MTKFSFIILLLAATFTASSQHKYPAQPDLPGDLLLDIGFNYWSQKNDSLKNWGSKSLGVYYTQRITISDKFSFYPGVGLTFEKFAFEGNSYVSRQNGVVGVYQLEDVVLQKNKLAITYFEVPLELRFHPKGTIDGEGFFLSAGVIGGLKMGSHTKLKYEEVEGTKRKEKFRSNFGFSDARYGLQARVGWKSFHVFYKKYYSEMYRKKTDGFNPTVTTLGINFTGF